MPARFLPGRLVRAETSGMPLLWQCGRRCWVTFLKHTACFQGSRTCCFIFMYIYNLCVMLLVPHPNLPRPTRALQLHGVDSIPAPSLGLPSSITATSPQAGAAWKCRAICKPGASPLVTRGGRFWASSGISEGPVGPCPLTHMMTCPQM